MFDWVSGAAAVGFLLTIFLLARVLPLLLWLVVRESRDGPAKIETLGGLRGVVALAVVVHHAVMSYLEHARGLHGAPLNNFQNQLGSTGVALFFMISAYLFCGPIIRDKGHVDLLKLVEGRFIRIVPLYLVLMCAIIFSAFFMTNFALLVSPEKLAKSVVRLSLFSFVEVYSINDFNIQNLFGHVWTLRYEWMLYATLPFLGFFMRLAGAVWPMFVGLFLCSLYDPMFSFFVMGAASAIFVRKFAERRHQILWQVAGAISLPIVLFAFHESQNWPQAILLTPFFVAILQGHRWFALIGKKPFKVLGDISFSLYLLHPFALRSISYLSVRAGWYDDMEVVGLVGVIVASTVASIAVAMIGFRLVEQPLIGKRPLYGWLKRRAGRGNAGAELPVRSFGSA